MNASGTQWLQSYGECSTCCNHDCDNFFSHVITTMDGSQITTVQLKDKITIHTVEAQEFTTTKEILVGHLQC